MTQPVEKSVPELVDLFFSLVEKLQPDLFVEAGAKDASSSRRAADLQIKRVVAFEASPVTYKRFAPRNTGIEYLNLALSDEPGTVSLNVRLDEHGDLKADGRASVLHFQKRSDVDFAQVSIPSTTLDRHFADHQFQSAALWVDVEGATGQVLTGGHAVLSRTSVMMVEVEDRRFWTAQWLAPRVLRHLRDHGLVPVARDRQSRHQYNVVLVRWSSLGVLTRLRARGRAVAARLARRLRRGRRRLT